MNRRVAVIGGGASGCMAALAAVSSGAEVILLEGNEKTGKKIYATGNGRCNLTNLNIRQDGFYTDSMEDPKRGRERVSLLVKKFSPEMLLDFFRSRGIFFHDRGGYVYPRTDQAATIALCLEKELKRSGVSIVLNTRIQNVSRDKEKYTLLSSAGEKWTADSVILCTGGMAGREFGCAGDGYAFAESFGHTILPVRPVLTGGCSNHPFLKRAAGVRCDAELSLRGEPVCRERGELQITREGLSGIPFFQLSHMIGKQLENHGKAVLNVDFLPEISAEELREEAERRLRESSPEETLGNFFLGMVHEKILAMLLAEADLPMEKKLKKTEPEQITDIFGRMKSELFEITALSGFSSAQATAGGICLNEVTDQMESIYQKDLFFAGELLDVDGICGGYNLQWAMTSGFLAGKSAAKDRK